MDYVILVMASFFDWQIGHPRQVDLAEHVWTTLNCLLYLQAGPSIHYLARAVVFDEGMRQAHGTQPVGAQAFRQVYDQPLGAKTALQWLEVHNAMENVAADAPPEVLHRLVCRCYSAGCSCTPCKCFKSCRRPCHAALQCHWNDRAYNYGA